ncbi:MAG TPA: SPASM domain-containing protein, partial [Desulfosarcina sp.]|nr:SPASM domain-containing protein [Desulfosarcina sp.]
LGFTMANTCYPMSIDTPESDGGLSAVYAANTVDDVVRFTPSEKKMLFAALAGAIRRFRSQIRIFSPLSSVDALVRQYAGGDAEQTYGCRGGVDFFFVNAADGNVYPCGYRGNENFGRLADMDIRKLKPPAESDACRRCDWECFRDPSELFGPLLEAANDPLGLMRRAAGRPQRLGAWIEDLLYYRACELFDGRRPPNHRRMQRFAPTGRSRTSNRGTFPAYRRFNQKLSVS